MTDLEFKNKWETLWSDNNDICEMVEDGLNEKLKIHLIDQMSLSEIKAAQYIKDVEDNINTPKSNNNEYKGPSFMALFIGSILLFMSIYFGNILLDQFLLSLNSKNWLQIQGTMIEKSITSEISSQKNSSGRQITYFSAAGSYEFQFNGITYTGNRLDFNNSSTGDYEKIEAFLANLPNPGENVTVYYNEKKHSAVLIPGVGSVPKWPMVPISLLFFIGFKIFKSGLPRKKSNSKY